MQEPCRKEKKRQGNILMLVEHAKAFESSQIKGLFHFVRFIEQCREYDMDYGEANTMSEDQDLVRISSIHKSKGLEYPIVFVSKIHQKFNLRDGNGSMIFHGDILSEQIMLIPFIVQERRRS